MLVNIIQNTISSFISAGISVITTNLKMWLGFETSSIDGDKQITPDKSGNNNVGELFTGKALEFNGSTNYVDIGDTSTNTNTIAITFVLDSEITHSDTALCLTNLTGSSFSGIFLGSFTGTLTNELITIVDGSSVKNSYETTTDSISAGVHRLVMVYNSTSSNYDIYLDGVQKTLTSSPSMQAIPADNILLGRRADGAAHWFEGLLSNVQIYNSAWAQADVTYDYANPQNLVTDRDGTSIELSNLKCYWHLSEGAGSFAYNSAVALGNDVVTDGDFPLPNVNWTIGNGTEIIASGARVNNTVTGGIAFVKQFLNNSPFGKTFLLTYDVVATNGNLLALQQASDLDLDTSTTGTNKKFVFTWDRTIDELTIKRKGGQTGGTDVTIDNIYLQEISAGVINGATYEPAQPRIPQLGMMDWAKSTPVADEITLIPNPNNTSQDILGNAVRDRLNSFNLGKFGGARPDAFTLSGNQATIQLWFKNVNSNDSLYLADLHSATDRIVLGFNSSQLSVYHEITGSWQNFGTITDGDWNFATFTFDGTSLKCFIGTSQLGVTKTITAINIGTTSDFGIGMNHSFPTRTQDYNGHISDFLIYDRLLTSDEIENNYNAGLSAHTN